MNKISLVLVLLLVGAGIAAGLGWNRVCALTEEKEALELKAEELERALAEAQGAAERAETSSRTDSQAQKSELLRLRNEVTQLRASAQAAANFQAENARLRNENQELRTSEQPAEAVADEGGQRLTRDEWTFQGNATPEAALVSTLWAVRDGQFGSYLNNLSPREQQRVAAKLQEKSEQEVMAEHQKEMAAITGTRILEQKQISPTEMMMNVYLEGPGRMQSVRMTQAGDEWKFDGVVDTQTVDPLQFYRQNPQLMRRYFPHLFQEGANQQPPQ